MPHTLLVQDVVETWSAAPPQVVRQAVPQPPQLLLSLMVLTSQPSATVPLQLAKPVLQPATVQLPTEQPAVPLGTKHWWPQLPQSLGLVSMLTSHPSVATLLQLAKPVLQLATVHAPPAQPAAALGSEHLSP